MNKYMVMAVLALVLSMSLGSVSYAGREPLPNVFQSKTEPGVTFRRIPPAANPSPRATDAPHGDWWCKCGNFGCNVVCVEGGDMNQISNRFCPQPQPGNKGNCSQGR